MIGCMIARAILARLVVSESVPSDSSWLGRHLRACAACRAELEQLRALSEDLQSSLGSRVPSANFATRVARGLGAVPGCIERPRSSIAWVTTGVVILGSFAAWWLLNGDIGSGQSQPEAGVFMPKVSAKIESSSPPTSSQAVVREEITSVITKPAAFHTKPSVARARKAVAAKITPNAVLQERAEEDSGSSGMQAEWTDLGAWYIASERFAHAADAYARAYEVEQDPILVYAAGWAAEAAGDVTNAIAYYAEYLEGVSRD